MGGRGRGKKPCNRDPKPLMHGVCELYDNFVSYKICNKFNWNLYPVDLHGDAQLVCCSTKLLL